MIDFTNPGADGALPDGFVEFQCGLIYSVDPRILSPLVRGQRYRIFASARQKVAKKDVESYGPFYRRAKALLDVRLTELQGENGDPVRAWVESHGWFGMDIPGGQLVGAVIALGVMCGEGVTPPAGQRDPTADDLRSPFVEQLPKSVADQREWSWDEYYNDFDLTDGEGSILTLSYGEYISPSGGIDFAPMVRRAEHRARLYHESLAGRADGSVFRIIRREWRCIETGKAARPLMAHVDVYFDTVASEH
jgi:hypothetical protein